ncbi:MAG: hypothetical protein NC293_02085 [Roseburia sp.]|nr:hypothetical protein [Roseburia sp.]
MGNIFFVIVLVCICVWMYLLPQRFRKYMLLAASVAFFLCVSPASLIYVAAVTVISWAAARVLDKEKEPAKRKLVLGVMTAAIVALLAGIKYSGIWRSTSIAIPLGLSYYSLMVIGHLVEVYRGNEKAERNFCRYSLFVCFFPQASAGPIGRSRDLCRQYEEGLHFDPAGIRMGFIMVLTGLFEKMVLADNINRFVMGILDGELAGITVVLAVFLYSLVIYFDFGGYSLIAVGSAKMLGVKLMDNFRAPYRSTSVQEFWRRWHISLSSWFRDYVYIPLGGSRKGSWRRDLNTLIVFVLSGMWHGAAAGYFVWGGIHGLYLVAGKRTQQFRERIFGKIRKLKRFGVWLQRAVVYILVSFAWVPFLAGSFWKMKEIVLRMFAFRPWELIDGSLMKLGLDWQGMVVCLLGTLFIFAIDAYQEKKNFYAAAAGKHVLIRFAYYILMVILIVLAGVYGTVYREADFIYGQF